MYSSGFSTSFPRVVLLFLKSISFIESNFFSTDSKSVLVADFILSVSSPEYEEDKSSDSSQSSILMTFYSSLSYIWKSVALKLTSLLVTSFYFFKLIFFIYKMQNINDLFIV